MELNNDNIQQAYIEYVLDHNEAPKTLYQFAKAIGYKEQALFPYFTSLPAIEATVWTSFFVTTKETIELDEIYQEYSVREKMLAFCYTLVELLKEHRSYLILSLRELDAPKWIGQGTPSALKAFKKQYLEFGKSLLQEGIETQEIEGRPLVTMYYTEVLWYSWWLILHFWLRDDSFNFEQTDTLIEKTVNLAFDLMGRTVVDSAVDLAKFLFANR